MNSRAFTLSLVIAGIAMFMVYSYLDGKEAQYVKEYGNLVSVVVAKSDIRALDLIDDRVVTIKNVPKNFVSPGHFKKPEDVFNTIAAVPILKGEQITKPRLTYPGSRSGLSRQISIGKRAMSVQVNENQAVSKLLKPGDRVDILTLVDYAGGRKEKIKVKTVLQDVLILSTGLNVTNAIPMVGVQVDKEIKKLKLDNYTNYNTVTLELTPYEVQKLVFLIQAGGGIYFTLRNNDDKAIERLTGTRLYDVLGEDAAEARAYFAEKDKQR